jgi:hypothetical protein
MSTPLQKRSVPIAAAPLDAVIPRRLQVDGRFTGTDHGSTNRINLYRL